MRRHDRACESAESAGRRTSLGKRRSLCWSRFQIQATNKQSWLAVRNCLCRKHIKMSFRPFDAYISARRTHLMKYVPTTLFNLEQKQVLVQRVNKDEINCHIFLVYITTDGGRSSCSRINFNRPKRIQGSATPLKKLGRRAPDRRNWLGNFLCVSRVLQSRAKIARQLAVTCFACANSKKCV